MTAMPGLLNLAAAGQLSLAEASDIASNVLSGFGLNADQSARAADVLAAASTSSNTNVQMLGQTMKVVAPVASAMGISVEQVAAAAGRLGDAGIQGSEGGTALRGILAKLSAPSKEAADFDGPTRHQGRDGRRQDEVVPGHHRRPLNRGCPTDQEQRAQALSTLAGQEAMSGLAALVRVGGDELAAYTTQLEGSKGAAAALAETMLNTLDGASASCKARSTS